MDFELDRVPGGAGRGDPPPLRGPLPPRAGARPCESADRVVDREGWRRPGRGRGVRPVPGRGGRRRRARTGRGGAGLRGARTGAGARSPGRLPSGRRPGRRGRRRLGGGRVWSSAGRSGRGARRCRCRSSSSTCDDLDVLLVLSDDGVGALDPAIARRQPACAARWTRSPRCGRCPVLPARRRRWPGPTIVAWWRRDGAVLTAALQVGAGGRGPPTWPSTTPSSAGQFGRPIGGFQAVKHLCADMAVRAEVARCAVQAAAVTVDQPDVGDAEVAAAGAKLLADEAAIANGRSCIQVHGGMGFTWEVPAHLAYKRARVLATQFGTDDDLAESLAESLAGRSPQRPPGRADRTDDATPRGDPVTSPPIRLAHRPPDDVVTVLPAGRTVFGMQLPVQSQSTIYVAALGARRRPRRAGPGGPGLRGGRLLLRRRLRPHLHPRAPGRGHEHHLVRHRRHARLVGRRHLATSACSPTSTWPPSATRCGRPRSSPPSTSCPAAGSSAGSVPATSPRSST